MHLKNDFKSAIQKSVLVARAPYYHLLNHRAPKRLVLVGVPYFAQWESRGLVASLLRGDIKAEDDPSWKSSGAKSRAEYAAWSWAGCGMACLKMVLAHRYDEVFPLVVLGKRCAAYGGYTVPLERSIGLEYQPFAKFVHAEFDLSANPVTLLSQAQIVCEIARRSYVIASVSPMIRDTASRPMSTGGHLVLMVGYDLKKQEFYLHNPSGASAATEAYAAVSFKDFQKFFANRGIILKG